MPFPTSTAKESQINVSERILMTIEAGAAVTLLLTTNQKSLLVSLKFTLCHYGSLKGNPVTKNIYKTGVFMMQFMLPNINKH